MDIIDGNVSSQSYIGYAKFLKENNTSLTLTGTIRKELDSCVQRFTKILLTEKEQISLQNSTLLLKLFYRTILYNLKFR